MNSSRPFLAFSNETLDSQHKPSDAHVQASLDRRYRCSCRRDSQSGEDSLQHKRMLDTVVDRAVHVKTLLQNPNLFLDHFKNPTCVVPSSPILQSINHTVMSFSSL
jgi:hypothetical protein